MTRYEEIIALRQELKKPGIFRHNHIQMRMLVWHLTIRCSVFFKRFMDIILADEASSTSEDNYMEITGSIYGKTGK